MPTQSPTVYMFVHVPKCAGRTIVNHMRKHLSEEQYWITSKRFVHLPQIAGRNYRSPKPGALDNVRFVSGHYVGRSIERLLTDRMVRKATLLREPVSFYLSYYNFRMMRYLTQGWEPYSFDLHVRSQPHDPICHFLLSRWLELPWAQLLMMSPERKYDLVNEALSNFWYVADYTYCDELVALMSGDLGIEPKPERFNTQEAWQKRTNWRPIARNDLTAEQVAAIESRTAIDRAIWQTWREARLMPQSARRAVLEPSAPLRFQIGELKRTVYTTARRYQRGWTRASQSGPASVETE